MCRLHAGLQPPNGTDGDSLALAALLAQANRRPAAAAAVVEDIGRIIIEAMLRRQTRHGLTSKQNADAADGKRSDG